ncbi:unnamed protein product [Kluyveromyces dobzhanskii CBS 2104]|uniref:WGS project CCBQ000000000 data, contig 00028 n=1 Tax=Kluyveromyces dobzhanskii CBS 2104 TaxID=1427455 RepID=A0A0A8L0H8_9SACH|nr:unnamed protein product [Kluyveromyces dobzhanskii CBS 2104]
MSVVADKIAELVILGYNGLPASGKPGVRSNGVKEWTVLAGVVAFDDVNDEFELISLGTGVKATTEEELKRSGGRIVHDCHAEIVSLRGFNAMLLKEIQDLQKGLTSFLVEKTSGCYKVKDKWSFAIYVSRIPCGDASMDVLSTEEQSDSIDYDLLDGDYTSRQYIDPDIDTIIRGRANYKLRRVVRTKPGRFDSKLSLSKSCSDKLTMKQMTSICNSLTWTLLETPTYLDFVVLPNRYKTEILRLEDTFWARLAGQEFTNLNFLFTDQSFADDQSNPSQKPSLSSYVALYNSNGMTSEVILNGVKNGFYTKGKKPLRKGCQTIISRYALWETFKRISNHPSNVDYLTFKANVHDRSKVVCNAKIALSAHGWIPTHEDNC